MTENSSLLESLPGSSRVAGPQSVVSNYTLMPIPSKHPGMSPSTKFSVPAPHLLGSGSKIPESHESRMRSQFSSPDPALYSRRRREEDTSSHGSGLVNEIRYTMPSNAYRSDMGGGGSGSSDGRVTFAEKTRASNSMKNAIAEKVKAKSEAKKLMGTKEALLSNLCSNPHYRYGDPEIQRVVNIVMDINKKLGLPLSNMGNWAIPKTCPPHCTD